MTDNLPLIPAHTIGSHAWPAWLYSALDAMQRGEYGPKDWQETQEDAVDLALRDQEDAGIDIVTDGEMRRIGFFTAGFYGHLTGLRELAPQRKMGVIGHDQRESYEAIDRVGAPGGLGLVEEYHYVRARTARPIKMPIAGPYTLAGRIKPGSIYRDRMDVSYAMADIINAEMKALVAAGADFIQVDEPSYAVHASSPAEFVKLFNHTVAGVNAKISVHLCFGNFVGRSVAKRTYRPLFPHILDMHVSQYALEFANRELFELDLWKEFGSEKELAAGLVDVKNYYCETAEDVAERLRFALKFVPAEKLSITPDCGLSQTARWAARAKLKAMVEGAKIVRKELTG
ncbi:MAG: methionine synthase [Anaerolineae bacterium]|nr:methionine synthase [Anaerolineae bacterium]